MSPMLWIGFLAGGAGLLLLIVLTFKNAISPKKLHAIEQLIENGTIQGGMIPKARACILASRSTRETRIIDGTVEHALLEEFEQNPGGTTIVRDELA